MLLYLIAALGDFVQMLFLFTLTRYLAEQIGDTMQLGIVGGSLSLTYAACSALFGHLSDRVGRRRFVAAGAVMFMVCLAVALHSMEPPLAYLEAALMGLAAAMVFPPLIALLTTGQRTGDVSREASQPLVLYCLSWNAGMLLGQSTGGLLFAVDPRLSLKLAMGAALMMIPLIALVRVRTANRQPAKEKTRLRNERAFSVPARFFAFSGWASNITSALSMSLIFFLFPQLATQLGIPASVHGAMLAAARVVVVGMYFLLHFTDLWRHRISPSLAVKAIASAGLVLVSFSSTVPLLTVGLMCASVMAGYIYFSGIFYSTTSFGQKNKGVAGGMHEATLAVGLSGGSLGGGYLSARGGLRLPYQVCAALLVVSMVLQTTAYLVLRRKAVD